MLRGLTSTTNTPDVINSLLTSGVLLIHTVQNKPMAKITKLVRTQQGYPEELELSAEKYLHGCYWYEVYSPISGSYSYVPKDALLAFGWRVKETE